MQWHIIFTAHYREVREQRHRSVALQCMYANIRQERPAITWLHGDKILDSSNHVRVIKPVGKHDSRASHHQSGTDTGSYKGGGAHEEKGGGGTLPKIRGHTKKMYACRLGRGSLCHPPDLPMPLVDSILAKEILPRRTSIRLQRCVAVVPRSIIFDRKSVHSSQCIN